MPSKSDSHIAEKGLEARTECYLRCHHKIEKLLCVMEAGAAASYDLGLEFKRMKTERLYKVQYDTFEAYLGDAHDGLSATWANRLVRMTLVYSRDEVKKGGLCATHLLILATADLNDEVRKGVEDMVYALRPTADVLKEAIGQARAAASAGCDREAQKRAAQERLEMAVALKRKRKAEREARKASSADKEKRERDSGWVRTPAGGPAHGMTWEEFQPYSDLRLKLRDLDKKTGAFLPALAQTALALQELAAAELAGPQPMLLWEKCFGLYQRLPRILAEVAGHFAGAEGAQIATQVAAEPAVQAAVAERALRLEAVEKTREEEEERLCPIREREHAAALERERADGELETVEGPDLEVEMEIVAGTEMETGAGMETGAEMEIVAGTEMETGAGTETGTGVDAESAGGAVAEHEDQGAAASKDAANMEMHDPVGAGPGPQLELRSPVPPNPAAGLRASSPAPPPMGSG